jgi:hypothetical protein
MRRSIAISLAASIIVAGLAGSPSPAEARSCALIQGSGTGLTEGIARWMANKAVVDSAKKWAKDGAHTLTPVKITCSGFSCDGAAKACKK